MEHRRLGKSELMVTPWCFGGNVLGWTADEKTSFTLLDAFVDAGFNFIDTADVYSRWVPGHTGGESETILGAWLRARGNRDKIVIASKVGMEMGPGKDNLSKAYIAEAIEASLKRLKTDYIDLYQSHRDDAKTPIEETLEAYASLIRSGKVRVIGASNFSSERLSDAVATSAAKHLPRYQSLQPEYNLYDRAGFEAALQPLCIEHEIGVISYFSLAAGFLTGKYRSDADYGKSPRGGGMSKYMNERGGHILATLDKVSESIGSTPAQIALAWVMAQPGITAAIASATTLDQVQSLAAATRLTLSPEQLAQLDRASHPE